MASSRQKRLTTEDVLTAVLASDTETDYFSEDETSGESLAEDFLGEYGSKCAFSVLPTVDVCFVPDAYFRGSLLIDGSDHDQDCKDYNDAGNAIIDPLDDPSHNHDKSSSELDLNVPSPSP